MKKYLILFLFIVSHNTLASNYILNNISLDSLIETTPEIFNELEFGAFDICSNVDIIIEKNQIQSATYTRVTKVTDKSGVESVLPIIIPYRNGYDSVIIHKFTVIDPEGVEKEIDRSLIIDDITSSIDIQYDIYSDYREMHINPKGIQVGSILKYVYTIKNIKIILPRFSYSFNLLNYLPTHYNSFSIQTDTSSSLLYNIYKAPIYPEKKNVDDKVIMKWEVVDLMPIVFEYGSLMLSDVAPRVDFTTYPNWRVCGNEFYEIFWKDEILIPLSTCENNILKNLNLDSLSEIDKIRKIYYFVQNDVKYIGQEFGLNNYQPYETSLTCEKGYGDCKDKTAILIKLLKSVGVRSKPVLMATLYSKYQMDKSFPCFSFLDHAITMVETSNSDTLWLDATFKYAPLECLSPFVNGMTGIILDSIDSKFASIPENPSGFDNVELKADVKLFESGDASIKLKRVEFGIPGAKSKFMFSSMMKSQLDNYIHSGIKNSKPKAYNIEYEYCGLNDNDSLFQITESYEVENYAQKAGDLMIIPSSGNFSSMFDNSGRVSTRHNDLYLPERTSYKSKMILTFPENYKINHLTEDKEINNSFFYFKKTMEKISENQISRSYILRIKQPYIIVESYPLYSAYLSQMDDVATRSIVLEKK